MGMARRWVNLVGVTPLLLGMVVFGQQMVVAPLVLAQTSQSSQSSQRTEAQSLYEEGETLRRQGTRESLQHALEKYQQALPLFRASGDRNGESDNFDSISRAYNGLGQMQQALDYLQQALPIYREVGDRYGEANTLSNLASLQRTLNDLPTALQNIQAAIAIIEDIQGQLISPELRTSYLTSLQRYYKLQIDLLMELHTATTLSNPDQSYAAQAFNITERSKAITLLKLLTESKVDIRNGVDPQLRQQEQEIQSQLGAIDQRRIVFASNGNMSQGAIAALETQRATLQIQYRELQTQIRATSPKYAALKYPQTLTLDQVQQQILDDDTIILSYSIGAERSYSNSHYEKSTSVGG